MKRNNKAFSYLTPLLISVFFFFISFYFCILGVSLFYYSLPFFALSLLYSFLLFYRMDRKLYEFIKKGIQTHDQYHFYHFSIGIFLGIFVVLFGMSVIFLPYYYNGGMIFVWCNGPLAILCFLCLGRAQKRLYRLKATFLELKKQWQ